MTLVTKGTTLMFDKPPLETYKWNKTKLSKMKEL